MQNVPFPVDKVHTAIALGTKNKAFIADRVMPRVGVAAQEFKWLEYTDAEHFTRPDTVVGRKGVPNEVEFTATEQSSFTLDYGLEDAIPQYDIERAKHSKFNPTHRATAKISELMDLDREIAVAALVMDINNFTYNDTPSGTDLWTDADSKPLEQLEDALNTPMHRPNHAVMSRAVFTQLRRNPSVVRAYNGTTGSDGMVPISFLQDVLGVAFVIGEAKRNSNAHASQGLAMQNIWSDDVALLYLEPGARPDDSLTWGLTADWGGRIAGAWDDKNIGIRGGKRIRVGESRREIVMAKAAGFFIASPLS